MSVWKFRNTSYLPVYSMRFLQRGLVVFNPERIFSFLRHLLRGYIVPSNDVQSYEPEQCTNIIEQIDVITSLHESQTNKLFTIPDDIHLSFHIQSR